MKDKDGNYRVQAKADLSSTWIETENTTHQATRRDIGISVKDGYMTGNETIQLEMWAHGDKPHVLNLWKFEDIDEFVLLADMMKERAEQLRKDKEMGLVE